jgi:hypothetical protein
MLGQDGLAGCKSNRRDNGSHGQWLTGLSVTHGKGSCDARGCDPHDLPLGRPGLRSVAQGQVKAVSVCLPHTIQTMAETQIRVLSLNCWYVIAQHVSITLTSHPGGLNSSQRTGLNASRVLRTSSRTPITISLLCRKYGCLLTMKTSKSESPSDYLTRNSSIGKYLQGPMSQL